MFLIFPSSQNVIFQTIVKLKETNKLSGQQAQTAFAHIKQVLGLNIWDKMLIMIYLQLLNLNLKYK